MADKKALKGFRDPRLFPVTTNTTAAYAVGEALGPLEGQNLTKEEQRQEYTIYSNDGVYDAGSDFQYETIELTTAELPLGIESALRGSAFTEVDGIHTAKSTDVAPEFALSYAALNASGGYRLFRHPVLKLMSVKVDHATKGDSNEIAPYRLSLRSTARKIDGAVRETKDVAKGDALAWIQTLEALPVGG